MCGRFALFASGEEVAERFQLAELMLFEPRYNIAPTPSVPAVRAGDGGRFLSLLRWGLIPSWSTDPKLAYKLINARLEMAASKPSFRTAFKQRRCLIPASAFYEWQKVSAKNKQPYCIRPRDGGLFAFAGLRERWHDPTGEVLETCTIRTTEANELMRPLHDRMPVILDAAAENLWLDPPALLPMPCVLCSFHSPASGWKPTRSVRGYPMHAMKGRAAWSRLDCEGHDPLQRLRSSLPRSAGSIQVPPGHLAGMDEPDAGSCVERQPHPIRSSISMGIQQLPRVITP
jgi:putative SOS response-associated peptidase YedK